MASYEQGRQINNLNERVSLLEEEMKALKEHFEKLNIEPQKRSGESKKSFA